jgi:hypothetical protein
MLPCINQNWRWWWDSNPLRLVLQTSASTTSASPSKSFVPRVCKQSCTQTALVAPIYPYSSCRIPIETIQRRWNCRVLQTFALPLGYRALEKTSPRKQKPAIPNRGHQKLRALIKSLPARTLPPTNAATRTTTGRTARKREFVSKKHLPATYLAVRIMSTAFFLAIRTASSSKQCQQPDFPNQSRATVSYPADACSSRKIHSAISNLRHPPSPRESPR